MSKSLGKRKEEDEYASEGDNPPKKSSRTDDSDDEDGSIVVCEISKNRRVSVRSFGGKIMVDIREFYVKDGKQMPGRKAEGLSETETASLPDIGSGMDCVHSTFQTPLSGNILGISLSMDQWNVLRDHADEIDEAVAENN